MKQNVFVTEWIRSASSQVILVKDLNGRVLAMFETASEYAAWCEEKLTLESE